jgi:aspartyl-tRNA(Asn)/glutamyl-tRNA(Gln) amidotransferase subunit B
MSKVNYSAVIGLEVHVELKTRSKMFCRCSNEYFGKKPNTHCCPVCLGLPGALPVPNRVAIEWCVKIALALNCEINLFSKFDRKNYFYPDLPKGYQISQYDLPFGKDGKIKLKNGRSIRVRRVHMEEDTAKLAHRDGSSLIDFNRSGVPLVEIVTEPDFRESAEVKEYLQKLQQIVRYLDVSDADMDKGEMRLEPNISLREARSDDLPKYKVEVKNINSFRFVEKAIEYELKRQSGVLEKGELPVQETRGWDENKQKTFSQRIKEEAMDYRYFPEPDIPPIRWTKKDVERLRSQLPELPDEKVERFEKDFGLPYYDAEILTRDKAVADFFEEAKGLRIKVNEKIQVKDIANAIINKKVDVTRVKPEDLVKQIASAKKIVVIDEGELRGVVEEVVKENEKAVADYKGGKQGTIMFLVGQTMRKIGKKVDAVMVRKFIENRLK